jgi:hypothetical protein
MALRICPSCGSELAATARFCPNCTAMVPESAPVVPTSRAPRGPRPVKSGGGGLSPAAKSAYYVLVGIIIVGVVAYHGCRTIGLPGLADRWSSQGQSSGGSLTISPGGDGQDGGRRGNPRQDLAALRKFQKSANAANDMVMDHVKALRQYVDQPHFDDAVWRDNISAEARGVEDEAERGRQAHAPRRQVQKSYRDALDDFTSGAHELQKAVAAQDEDRMQRCVGRINTASEKMARAREEARALEETLAAGVD